MTTMMLLMVMNAIVIMRMMIMIVTMVDHSEICLLDLLNISVDNEVKMSHDLEDHISFQRLRTDHLLDAGTGSKIIRTLPVIMKIQPPPTVSTAGVFLASTTGQAIDTGHRLTTLDATVNDYTTSFSDSATSDVDENNVIGILKQPVVSLEIFHHIALFLNLTNRGHSVTICRVLTNPSTVVLIQVLCKAKVFFSQVYSILYTLFIYGTSRSKD